MSRSAGKIINRFLLLALAMSLAVIYLGFTDHRNKQEAWVAEKKAILENNQMIGNAAMAQQEQFAQDKEALLDEMRGLQIEQQMTKFELMAAETKLMSAGLFEIKIPQQTEEERKLNSFPLKGVPMTLYDLTSFYTSAQIEKDNGSTTITLFRPNGDTETRIYDRF